MKKVIFTLTVALATGIATLNAQVTNGLVAKYSFNNGNANDEVGSNHGTVNGAMLTTDRFGNANMAYKFKGNGDNINIGNAVILKPTNGTISVWIKRDSVSTSGGGYSYNPVLLNRAHSSSGSYEGYAIYISTINDKIVPVTTDTTTYSQTFFTSNVSVQNNQWLHIVIAYNNDSLWLYQNGQLDTKVFKGYTSLFSPLYDIVMGHNSLDAGNNRSFAGSIDDIRIYNRVLTPIEIDSLFNEPNPVTTGINNNFVTNNSINIYPNPTKNQINFSIQTNVQLTSVTGQILSDSKNVNTIDLSDQPTGIYFLTFTDNEGQVVQRSKIMKE